MEQVVKKLRVLTLALIFSGALNIGLVATCIFAGRQEFGSVPVRALAKKGIAQETMMDTFFEQIAKLSFHELLTILTNRDPVGEGYLKRDMAASALVRFHHFNLEKALSGSPLQRREIALGKEPRVAIFPGLSDEQFDAIIRFAYEEKWPLTAEGIFKLLKQKPDESLSQAFSVTPEFHALQTLFPKTEQSLLLQLVSEGDWATLDLYAREQAQLLDLSAEKKQSLLLQYLAFPSRAAAALLLQTDAPFVAKRLEDARLTQLISLLPEKSADGERLCQELLRSPRTDAVWIAAAAFLYAGVGETVPVPLDLQAAIARFTSAVEKKAAPKKVETQARYHTVKDGESLWKIAKLYNMKVDELVKMNHLEKDRILPGMTLKIKE